MFDLRIRQLLRVVDARDGVAQSGSLGRLDKDPGPDFDRLADTPMARVGWSRSKFVFHQVPASTTSSSVWPAARSSFARPLTRQTQSAP